MSALATPPGRRLRRLLALLSDLRLAIVLLLLIAVASGIGTAIPQREPVELYHRLYDPQPWLGLLRGDGVLALQLDHVYSSGWFLALLTWLGLALILCSWRRQWPALQASLRWIDYSSPRQLSKLAVAQTVVCPDAEAGLDALAESLRLGGWQIRRQPDRLAARRGVAGRVGPLLVHAGLVVLMVGAAWGALAGQRLEQFLAPGRELELVDSRGRSQITIALEAFSIERDPAGRPEQFRSQLRLIPPAAPQPSAASPSAAPPEPLGPGDSPVAPAAAPVPQGSPAQAPPPLTAPVTAPGEPVVIPPGAMAMASPAAPAAGSADSLNPGPLAGDPAAAIPQPPAGDDAGGAMSAPGRRAEISVNHPLRYQGLTLYQADWALAAVNLRLGRSPVLQLPLQSFPQLGEQVWGLVLPTRPDGSEPVFLALSSEQGPADVYGPDGTLLGRLSPGGNPLEVRGLPLRLESVLPASGILLKRDPGVPLVYTGFAVALLGGGLSLVATRQLWAVAESSAASPPPSGAPAAGQAQAGGGQEAGPSGRVHLGGLCNRNLPAFAAELPQLLAQSGLAVAGATVATPAEVGSEA